MLRYAINQLILTKELILLLSRFLKKIGINPFEYEAQKALNPNITIGDYVFMPNERKLSRR